MPKPNFLAGQVKKTAALFGRLLGRWQKDELSSKRMKEAEVLFRDPKELRAERHKDLFQKYCEYLLTAKDYERFNDFGHRAESIGAKTAAGVYGSSRNRYLLDRAATAAGWTDEERPKFWWMRGPFPGNFGDILTPFLVWNLYKIPVRWAPCAKADCLAIGSIAKCATPGIKVWGAGIANPDHEIEPAAEWLAVRGPITQEILGKAGGKVPDVIGDPALLLSRAYQPKVNKTGYGLIIPHYLHVSRFQNVLKMETKLEPEQVRILSPIVNGFEGIREFCDQVASADWVVASSLHGLIVAHAYGVKCCWAMPERSAPESPNESIKYTDYMRSVGLPTNLSVLENRFNLDEVVAKACLPAKLPDLDALEAAFPFRGLAPRKPVAKASLESIFVSGRTNNIKLALITKTSEEEPAQTATVDQPSSKREAKRAERIQARKAAKADADRKAHDERKAARVAARRENRLRNKNQN